jgi:transcriptional regulator with XRE-family HTH domain
MDSSFGTRLQSQREKKGVSLAEISRQTKIKASLLESLERGDLSYWPHGLFGRAYIRSYAQAIGAEPESLLREFLELHPDPPDEFLNGESAPPTGISGAIRTAVGAIPGLLRRTDRDRVDQSTAIHGDDTESSAEPARLIAPEPDAPQLKMLAELCTRIQRAEGSRDLVPVLGAVSLTLGASGLVLWRWDTAAGALKPWLTQGYPAHVVAQLPSVRREDENAIAAAFRTCDTCIVDKGSGETGAVVVPLVSAGRCVGALALELGGGGERRAFVRDAAVIIATLLVQFVDVVPLLTAASA